MLYCVPQNILYHNMFVIIDVFSRTVDIVQRKKMGKFLWCARPSASPLKRCGDSGFTNLHLLKSHLIRIVKQVEWSFHWPRVTRVVDSTLTKITTKKNRSGKGFNIFRVVTLGEDYSNQSAAAGEWTNESYIIDMHVLIFPVIWRELFTLISSRCLVISDFKASPPSPDSARTSPPPPLWGLCLINYKTTWSDENDGVKVWRAETL